MAAIDYDVVNEFRVGSYLRGAVDRMVKIAAGIAFQIVGLQAFNTGKCDLNGCLRESRRIVQIKMMA